MSSIHVIYDLETNILFQTQGKMVIVTHQDTYASMFLWSQVSFQKEKETKKVRKQHLPSYWRIWNVG